MIGLSPILKIMIINEKYLLDYLLKENKIEIDDLITGRIEIKQFSQRNICYSFTTRNFSYFFKQSKLEDDFNASVFLNEVNIYINISHKCCFLPKFNFYDSNIRLLSIEYLRYHLDFYYLIKRDFNSYCTVLPFVFSSLKKVHNTDISTLKNSLSYRHWIFYLFSNFERYYKARKANTRLLINEIQSNTEIIKGVSYLNKNYSNGAFILGDLKIRNVLVNTNNKSDIKYIDLEFAGKGDPKWDIASCIIASCLYHQYFIDSSNQHLDNSMDDLIKNALRYYFNINDYASEKCIDMTLKIKGLTGLKLLQFLIESTVRKIDISKIRVLLDYAYFLIKECTLEKIEL